jgi:antitoxin component YwqK of YwqJK toxin-antitoxin module
MTLKMSKHEVKFDKIPKDFTGIVECRTGRKGYYLNGKLHREDGPAFTEASGTKYWLANGKLHREDGPAIEYADDSKYHLCKSWYLNGKIQKIIWHLKDGGHGEVSLVQGGKYRWYLNDKLILESQGDDFKNEQT